MANSTATPLAFPLTFDQPLDISNLKARSVLVTGGASGIGLACATKFAEAGALVTISDLQDDAGQAVARSLSSKGYAIQFVKCDVTSYQAQVEMFWRTIEFGNGKIDIVVPNAGVLAEKNVFDMVPEEPPTTQSPPPKEPGFSGVEVNLHAVYNTCYLAAHYFRLPRNTDDTFKPSIVLIASLAGYVGYPSSSTYSMSKFGVRGLFYGFRERAAQFSPPVRVNLIAPWFIDTPMTRDPDFLKSPSGGLLQILGFAPMERVVDAIIRLGADQNAHGRAVGIFPASIEDIGDDLEGEFGGRVLPKHMSKIAEKIAKAMAETGTQPGQEGSTHLGSQI
ncbi:NAD(P)-binding protein [Pyrenochaeta sp. DS3sAY3a]|nr:NAD(P)-binding protein [Pyrenochaeta sp. DS3sAY3a]